MGATISTLKKNLLRQIASVSALAMSALLNQSDCPFKVIVPLAASSTEFNFTNPLPSGDGTVGDSSLGAFVIPDVVGGGTVGVSTAPGTAALLDVPPPPPPLQATKDVLTIPKINKLNILLLHIRPTFIKYIHAI